MRIGMLGTGVVGRTLGGKLTELGHDVGVGSRDPERSFAAAAEHGEIVFNATAGTASLEALALAGAENLAGKTLVDVANALDFSAGFPPTLSVCNDDSLAEQIQREFPEARVVKTLNTMNADVMVEPGIVPGDHVVFVASDHDDAKADVRGLLESFGWPAERIIDLGGIGAARGTEMFLPLWLYLYQATGTAQLNLAVLPRVTARALALASFALLLVNVPAAFAGTATVGQGTLLYVAAPGENNSVGIAYDAVLHAYKITDSSAPVIGGPGCGASDGEADCEDKDINVILINLRDGNDKWLGASTEIGLMPSVDGGDGDDDLAGIGLLSGGAGNDTLKALDGGGTLDGGDGNDTLIGGAGDDSIDGGAGDDLLIGNDGKDVLTGGTGVDRIDASGAGAKTIDCQGRDDEVIQGGGGPLTRSNCAAAPKVTLTAARVKPARVLARKFAFSVACDRPCAVNWELRLSGTAKKLIHHTGGWIDRRLISLDKDGFRDPVAGIQRFTAGVVGLATKKALGRLKSFDVVLFVQAYGRDGLGVTTTKTIKVG